MYWNAEQQCRRFIYKFGGFVVFHHAPFIIALLFPIYCVCIGNFDTSTYYSPFRMFVPLSVDSVLRWYLFLIFQISVGNAYVSCVIPTISYFVCCGYYLDALCDHFDYLIELVDDEFVQIKGECDCAAIHKRSLNSRKLLSKAVDQHNKIYECVFRQSNLVFKQIDPSCQFYLIIFAFLEYLIYSRI